MHELVTRAGRMGGPSEVAARRASRPSPEAEQLLVLGHLAGNRAVAGMVGGRGASLQRQPVAGIEATASATAGTPTASTAPGTALASADAALGAIAAEPPDLDAATRAVAATRESLSTGGAGALAGAAAGAKGVVVRVADKLREAVDRTQSLIKKGAGTVGDVLSAPVRRFARQARAAYDLARTLAGSVDR